PLALYHSLLITATSPTEIYTLSLHDALPIWKGHIFIDIQVGPHRKGLEDHGKVPFIRRNIDPLGAGRIDFAPNDHFTFVQILKTDRKSTRLNSSHVKISYAVFCLKKKKQKNT